MEPQNVRQEWLKVLANASSGALGIAWARAAAAVRQPGSITMLRHPETGLAMIRARADGSGRPFNLGEATITRCVVAVTDSCDETAIMGVGYVLGRDKRHAEFTAFFDALFQDSSMDTVSRETILAPLRHTQKQTESRQAAKTAATRVDFFTMVRGE